MTSKKWLFASGLVVTAPIPVALWMGTAELVADGNINFGWSSGAGRMPGHASTSVEVVIITLVSSAAWLGGVWKVARMWRKADPR